MKAEYRALLADTVRHYSDMSRNSLELLAGHCTILEPDKQQTFIRQGLANGQEYFLLDGLVRSFASSDLHDDVTLYFYGPQSVLPPHTTRTANGLSTLNYESLTSCVLAAIPADVFSRLMRENTEIYRFAHTVLERELQAKTRKEIGMAVLPARDRLLELRAIFPALENWVAHAHIASYLGITQVSLSRLRKEIAQGG